MRFFTDAYCATKLLMDDGTRELGTIGETAPGQSS